MSIHNFPSKFCNSPLLTLTKIYMVLQRDIPFINNFINKSSSYNIANIQFSFICL